MHYRLLSCTPGIQPLQVSNSAVPHHAVTIPNVSRYFQVSPGGQSQPRRESVLKSKALASRVFSTWAVRWERLGWGASRPPTDCVARAEKLSPSLKRPLGAWKAKPCLLPT